MSGYSDGVSGLFDITVSVDDGDAGRYTDFEYEGSVNPEPIRDVKYITSELAGTTLEINFDGDVDVGLSEVVVSGKDAPGTLIAGESLT